MTIDTELIERLREWAEIKPEIRRLWIYGSCARGDAGPDSDLDIAFETTGAPVDVNDFWFRVVRGTWTTEVANLCTRQPHFESIALPPVRNAVGESGKLIYARQSSSPPNGT